MNDKLFPLKLFVLVVFIFGALLWINRDRTDECLSRCFYRLMKETSGKIELNCESDCWDVLREHGYTSKSYEPNTTGLHPTECERWGFGYGCD